MNTLHKLQKASVYIWRKHYKLIDLINRNPLLYDFYLASNSSEELQDRFQQFHYLNETLIDNAPISYLEFGVFKGQSIGHWLKINRNPDSRFYGFDTFTGLPEDWSVNMKKGAFNLDGEIPNLGDERAELISGMFQDTLRPFLIGFKRNEKMVVHLDADLYSSTMFVLSQLDSILRKGDIIVFDEFGDLNGEFKAYLDYTSAFKRTLKPVSRVLLSSSWIVDKVAFSLE